MGVKWQLLSDVPRNPLSTPLYQMNRIIRNQLTNITLISESSRNFRGNIYEPSILHKES